MHFEVSGERHGPEPVVAIRERGGFAQLFGHLRIPARHFRAVQFVSRGLLADLPFDFALREPQRSLRLQLARFRRLDVTRVAIPQRQRQRDADARDGFLVHRFLPRKLRPDRDARPRFVFREPHFEALLREFDCALAQLEIPARRAADEFVHARQLRESRRHLRDDDALADAAPAKLIQLEQRLLRFPRSFARRAPQLDDRRLDGARLQQRSHARRLALHECRHQFLAALRDFRRRRLAPLPGKKRVAAPPHLRRERRAELLQSRLRELHAAVGNRLSQR